MKTDPSVLRLRISAAALCLALSACASSRESAADSVPAPAAGPLLTDAGAAPAGKDDAGVAEVSLPRVLTVEGAVTEALANNRRTRLSRRQVAIAGESAREARAGLLPRVDFRGSYSRTSTSQTINAPSLGQSFQIQPQGTTTYEIILDYPIFGSGRYLNAYREARLARQRTEADLQATESDVAAAVTAAAFDYLETKRQIGVARSNEEALARQVKDAKALLDAGRVTKSAVLEAELEYDRAKRERERRESLVAIRRILLNGLLGRPTDSPTDLVDDPIAVAPAWTRREVEAQALLQRPEARAAELEVRRARRHLDAVIGRELPELRGSVTFHGDDNQFISPDQYLIFGFTLDIPLFEGGAKYARIRRAKDEMEVAVLQRSEVLTQVQTDAATSVREADESFKDIAVAKRSITRAQEDLRIQREKFHEGRATSQEVLRSTAVLNDARFQYVQSLYAYNVALRAVQRARGADPRLQPLAGPPSAGKTPPKETGGSGAAGTGGNR